MSKGNGTFPCCADEISQNLQKELFLSLINNHHNKGHPVMFFQKYHFDPPPPPPFHHYIRQWEMTTVGGLIKGFCPHPPPPPLTPTNKISYRGPCALLNVNKVETPMPPMWFFSLPIFKYAIGCSSLYLYLTLCNVSHYFHLVYFINYQVAYTLSYRLKD